MLESWKAGKLESWKAGKLESWKAGKLESWKAGKLESWKAGKLERQSLTVVGSCPVNVLNVFFFGAFTGWLMKSEGLQQK